MADKDTAVRSFTVVGKKEDITDFVTAIDPDQTLLTNKFGKTSVKSTEHAWLNDSLRPAMENAYQEVIVRVDGRGFGVCDHVTLVVLPYEGRDLERETVTCTLTVGYGKDVVGLAHHNFISEGASRRLCGARGLERYCLRLDEGVGQIGTRLLQVSLKVGVGLKDRVQVFQLALGCLREQGVDSVRHAGVDGNGWRGGGGGRVHGSLCSLLA